MIFTGVKSRTFLIYNIFSVLNPHLDVLILFLFPGMTGNTCRVHYTLSFSLLVCHTSPKFDHFVWGHKSSSKPRVVVFYQPKYLWQDSWRTDSWTRKEKVTWKKLHFFGWRIPSTNKEVTEWLNRNTIYNLRIKWLVKKNCYNKFSWFHVFC